MRVLQVLGDTDVTEVSSVAVDLHGALSSRGLDVRTVALGPGRRGGLDPIVPVLSPSRRSLAAHTQFRREQGWAHAVLLWGARAAATAGLLTVRDGPPWVLALPEGASTVRGVLRRRLLRVLDRGGPLVLTERGAGRELPVAAGAAGPEPVVIPFGVPEAPVTSAEARLVARRELNLAPLGAVARWVGEPRSGRVDGREVARWAASRAGIPLVGLDEGDRHGVRAEMTAAAADIAVLPTTARHGPRRGLLLAARSGAALVAPAEGALAGLVDARTGIPCQPDPGSVADALSRLADHEARAECGAAAAARVRSAFGLDRMADAWVELLAATVD